jgi:hypothetical protein
VDQEMYDKQAWQLWEDFGAGFHAARINAWLVLGSSTLPFELLFPGAVVHGCDYTVKLRPMAVFRTSISLQEVGFSEPLLPQAENSAYSRNWLTTGLVVLNGDSGAGLDLFLALELLGEGVLVFVDQRKRVAGCLGATTATKLLEKARGKLEATGEVKAVVAGLFNTLPNKAPGVKDLPVDSIVVAFPQSGKYHGCLCYHPASTPLVCVNDGNKTSLRLVFKGATWKAVIDTIFSTTPRPRFADMDQFQAFVSGVDESLELAPEQAARMRFA